VGGKRARKGKFLCLCIAGLIFLVSISIGCAVWTEKKQVKVGPKREEVQKEEERLKALSGQLLRARKLLARQDYEGSLRENQKVLSLSGKNPPGDEALFNMGLIYAHPENPKKDYGRSLSLFQRLVKEYPQSSLAEQAKIWAGILYENEKLNQTIEKLNQMIEETKQVDIQIEEKKREKGK